MIPTSIQVGALTVAALADGRLAAPAASFFPDAPASAWQDEAAYLNANGLFAMNIGCFLVREAGQWSLVDTGDGTRAGSYGGRLREQLALAGVAPEEIVRVILTHLHGDHIGGATEDRDGEPAMLFPRARHVLQRREWEARAELAAGTPHLYRCLDPVAQAGLLELVDGDVALSAGISTLLTPGHTPGHQCVLLASQGEQAVIVGDLTHSPMQLNHADWRLPAEWDAEASASSRAAVFDRAEREGLLLCAGHYPYPSMGHVLRAEQRRRWHSIR